MKNTRRWFHGDITTSEAEARLMRRCVGTFLVRFSSVVGCFAITKVIAGENDSRKTVHQRILRTPDYQFAIGEDIYPSLVVLISQNANKLGLLYPCFGSQYKEMFFRVF